MQQKHRIGSVLLVLLLPIVLAYPQIGNGSFSVGLHSNLAMPQTPGEFKASYRSGPGFGAEFRYNFNEMGGIMIDCSYRNQNIKTSQDTILMELIGFLEWDGVRFKVEGGNLVTKSISTSLFRYFSKPDACVRFYLTAGCGFYLLDAKSLKAGATYNGEPFIGIQYWGSEPLVKIGLSEGLGIEKKFKKLFTAYVETNYTYIFSESLTYEFIWSHEGGSDPEARLSYLTFQGGVRLNF